MSSAVVAAVAPSASVGGWAEGRFSGIQAFLGGRAPRGRRVRRGGVAHLIYEDRV